MFGVPNGLAKQSFGATALDSIANTLACHDPKLGAVTRLTGSMIEKNRVLADDFFAVLVDQAKLPRALKNVLRHHVTLALNRHGLTCTQS